MKGFEFCEEHEEGVAGDGEVVCLRCGEVLGYSKGVGPIGSPNPWSGSEDNIERILEEHISKRGWIF